MENRRDLILTKKNKKNSKATDIIYTPIVFVLHQ